MGRQATTPSHLFKKDGAKHKKGEINCKSFKSTSGCLNHDSVCRINKAGNCDFVPGQ